MTNTFWFNNPAILFDSNHITEIWPSSNLDYVSKLNAVTRLVILLTVVGFFTSGFFKILMKRYLVELAFNPPPRTGTRPVPDPYGSARGGWDILWFNFFQGGHPRVFRASTFFGSIPEIVEETRNFYL